MNYKQGIFTPKNPKKYKGDVNKICFRSSWELHAMIYFDKHPDIIEWSSEETIVPYVSPLDNRTHRYFIDFWIKNKHGQQFYIEVKPYSQTIEPKKGKKKQDRFIQEVETWAVNTEKWKSARAFAKTRNASFVLMTERELGI